MNLTTEIFKSERSWISFAIECNYPVGNSDISKNVFLKRKDDFIYLRTFSCNYSAKSKRAKPKCLADRVPNVGVRGRFPGRRKQEAVIA